MGKSDWLRSTMKSIFRPQRYSFNDSFYHHLDKLFSRRFPDTPLPLRRKMELAKLFDVNIVMPSLLLEKNITTFSVKTNESESITTNKISKDIINYITSVTNLSEYILEDTISEALETERDVLKIGEVLNKVFLLFKHLNETKEIKCPAIENILQLEQPFREATLLMCMAMGKKCGRAGRVIIICPQKTNKTISLNNFKQSDDDTLNKHLSLLDPVSISEDSTDKAHGLRCYKLALQSFCGAVIASNGFKLQYKIGNIVKSGKLYPPYLDAIRIVFLRKKYNSLKTFRFPTLYRENIKDKRIKEKIKTINTMFKSLQETERTPALKSEINKVVIDWNTMAERETKDKYEYRVLLSHKHFFMFAIDDSVLKILNIKSLQPTS